MQKTLNESWEPDKYKPVTSDFIFYFFKTEWQSLSTWSLFVYWCCKSRAFSNNGGNHWFMPTMLWRREWNYEIAHFHGTSLKFRIRTGLSKPIGWRALSVCVKSKAVLYVISCKYRQIMCVYYNLNSFIIRIWVQRNNKIIYLLPLKLGLAVSFV